MSSDLNAQGWIQSVASNEAGTSILDAGLAKLVSFFLEGSVKADSATTQVPPEIMMVQNYLLQLSPAFFDVVAPAVETGAAVAFAAVRNMLNRLKEVAAARLLQEMAKSPTATWEIDQLPLPKGVKELAMPS